MTSKPRCAAIWGYGEGVWYDNPHKGLYRHRRHNREEIWRGRVSAQVYRYTRGARGGGRQPRRRQFDLVAHHVVVRPERQPLLVERQERRQHEGKEREEGLGAAAPGTVRPQREAPEREAPEQERGPGERAALGIEAP